MAYRILIVEDEEIVRSSVKQTLKEWNEVELELREATDGLEGLKTARSFVPQIIITDIKMPGLDGLGMLARIKEELPEVKCLILSGYDDFEFARGAIELQVSSYLLKPFDDEELFAKLRRLIAETGGGQRRLQSAEDERDGRIRRLLLRGKDEKAPDAPELRCAEYICAELILLRAERRLPTVRRFCREFVQGELAPSQLFTVVTDEKGGRISMLIGDADPNAAARAVGRLAARLRQNGEAVLAGMGRPVRSPEEISRSREEASYAAEAAYFASAQSVRPTVYHDALRSEDRYNAARHRVLIGFSQLYSSLIAAVTRGEVREVKRLLDRMEATMRSYPEMGVAGVWAECDRLCSMLCSCAAERLGQDMSERERVLCEGIRVCASLSEAFEALARAAAEIESEVSQASEQLNGTVENMKRMIEKDYSRGITLAEIADRLDFSPNYLGVLFDRITGKSFKAYLAEYRIEQAKRLLATTELPVGRVAESVGFSDVTYFSTLFRKLTGMTPSSYRKM